MAAQSIEILASSSLLLADRCVEGLAANRSRARELVEQSLAMVTALAPRLGYDRAAEIAKEAFASGKTVREVALASSGLNERELDRVLDAQAQTEGGVRD